MRVPYTTPVYAYMLVWYKALSDCGQYSRRYRVLKIIHKAVTFSVARSG